MKHEKGLEARLQGCFSRNDGEPITREQAEKFFSDFLALCETNGFGFGGGCGILPDVERSLVKVVTPKHDDLDIYATVEDENGETFITFHPWSKGATSDGLDNIEEVLQKVLRCLSIELNCRVVGIGENSSDDWCTSGWHDNEIYRDTLLLEDS